ncbi:tudor domain-containing protein 3-like, partial [Lingula anatina]|uniref:Tudor domain-containing protein 3 n=1 Tax=Lingula anatina TaxID=7574 RepID=A0A1S3INF6_LINAN
MADAELKKRGWYLSPEGIEECTEDGRSGADDIIKIAMDTDMKQIGQKVIPEEINRGKLQSWDGPIVLQVHKIRNVTAPKDNEESNVAPRMLKITFTDGCAMCNGLEVETLKDISLNTPPGTKVKLTGKLTINSGFLQLTNSNIKCLGGRVERLVENWELKKSLAVQSRRRGGGEDGPPAFVPFGHKLHDTTQNGPRSRETFKSLESSKEEKKEGDGEFEQQRQAALAEAIQAKEDGKGKTFGGKQIQDKDIAKIVEMGFTPDQATNALRQTNSNLEEAIASLVISPGSGYRGGGRGGRGGFGRGGREDRGVGRGRGRGKEEEFEQGSSRPSAPATLFDFILNKAGPIKEDAKEKDDKPTKEGGGDNQASNKPPPPTAAQKQDRIKNLPPRLQNKLLNEQKAADPRVGQYSGPTPRESYQASSSYKGQAAQRGGGGGERPSQRSQNQDSRRLKNDYQNGSYHNEWNQNRKDYGYQNYDGYHHNESAGNWNANQQNGGYYNSNRRNDHYYQGGRGRGGGRGYGGDYGRGGDEYRGGRHGSGTSRGPVKQKQLYDPKTDQYVPPEHQQAPPNQYQQQDPNKLHGSSQYRNRGGGGGPQGHQQGQMQYMENYQQDGGAGNRSQKGNRKNRQQQQQQQDQYLLQQQLVQQDGQHQQHQHEQQQQQPQQQQMQAQTPQSYGQQTFIPGPAIYQTQNGQTFQTFAATQQPYYHPAQTQQGQMAAAAFQVAQVNQQGQIVFPAQQPQQPQMNSAEAQQWNEGDVCIAKFWEDQQWYKAVVIGVNLQSQISRVTFVDYGNNEDVPFSDMFQIPKDVW